MPCLIKQTQQREQRELVLLYCKWLLEDQYKFIPQEIYKDCNLLEDCNDNIFDWFSNWIEGLCNEVIQKSNETLIYIFDIRESLMKIIKCCKIIQSYILYITSVNDIYVPKKEKKQCKLFLELIFKSCQQSHKTVFLSLKLKQLTHIPFFITSKMISHPNNSIEVSQCSELITNMEEENNQHFNELFQII